MEIKNNDPGPKDRVENKQTPSSVNPPRTDEGDVPNFWFPFERAHNRIQEGGWARQVTVSDLPISTTIAGVNMRLNKGAIRELHWHSANEWAYMLYGNARITCFDQEGREFVDDVKEGDLWFFPSGYPHSIQGTGENGCEFLLVFDDGHFSENETFLITDWMQHTPEHILSKNLGLSLSLVKELPQHELYIFPGKVTKTLEEDKKTTDAIKNPMPHPLTYSPSKQQPNLSNDHGNVKIVDSKVFSASTAISAAIVTVKPGGMREMHWHPNADEWLYFISGQGTASVFMGVHRARTMDFKAGDVGYIPKNCGHYLINTGTEDVRYLEIFKSDHYAEVTLSEWLSHTPPELIQAHTNWPLNVVEGLSKKKHGFR